MAYASWSSAGSILINVEGKEGAGCITGDAHPQEVASVPQTLGHGVMEVGRGDFLLRLH